MAEWSIDVAIVAEPYAVPPSPHWAGDTEDLVAIVVFVAGDLNAKSTAWGNPATNPKGREVEEWALAAGLSLLNVGAVQTCVRWSGGSVVDVTFATPAIARRVEGWRVETGVETLSDHRYIRFEVSPAPVRPASSSTSSRGRSQFPRWALSKLDRELAEEAAIVGRWSLPPLSEFGLDEAASRLCDAFSAVCRAAMPPAKRPPPRRALYWWSAEIAGLRAACNGARREYTRSRRRRPQDVDRDDRLRRIYVEKTKILQQAICRAKEEAWLELVGGLERDPWGRPYMWARNKLRAQSAPISDTLQPDQLGRIVGELFPNEPEDFVPPRMARQTPDTEEGVPSPVTEAEMEAVITRLQSKKRAPGPDGVHGRVLAIALGHLGDSLRELFDRCLRSGQFPEAWKEGRLCLLPKAGRTPDSASAVRPVVLLNEAGKALEKIVASRLVQHLEEGSGPGLSESQFGFRARRSTVDALKRLRAVTGEAEHGREVVVAVSLDIANAFNSLPHAVIREALKYFGVPPYLRRLLEAYLSDRRVGLENRSGSVEWWRVGCGVPQGSVLGPILWDIGYDWVLRGRLLPGMGVICYADDTLVYSRGRNYKEATRLAEVGLDLVISRIESLGLRVRIDKTEALLFRGTGRKGPPPGATLQVGEGRVRMSPQMKYLGLILDGGWTFGPHFAMVGPKVVKAASALGRLLPNLGGPSAACRQLYSGVCRSMATYGAPVWADRLTAKNKAALRAAQRTIAVRVIRGYRTVSWAAATALAGDPPWELVAEVLAETYSYVSGRRALGENPTLDGILRVRRIGQEALMRRWGEDLAVQPYGTRVTAAIRPVLERWMRRKRKPLTFRLTQILTGHGCFGDYLCRTAQREPTTECHDCGAAVDSAQHTLEVCPRWAVLRQGLTSVIGGDLSLPSVITAMLGDDESWKAMVSFCETVMSQKEADERMREEAADVASIRGRRMGVRRRRYLMRLL
ncbi:unnamed protein product [Euphydryas editha]|uniref:Reverse transcriptase domain-containing protein n=1 Tax=Euphydryas editha TaxID=104508 RepID=A0AAU9UDI4_EUPED|nr:unnamed protein product [Euphydryas editha]